MTEVLSYRNQFIDLQSTSMGCFLHDRELGHEKVKCFPQFLTPSDIQTSKSHKYPGIHDNIWNLHIHS